LIFAASNTYSGPTIIGSGLTLALTGNGSLSHSALIFFGGTISSAIHLDASARADKSLMLAAGQTLSGVGAVGGNLTVLPGATLSPAGTNTTLGITAGANPVGTISATNNVTLGGATMIKLNGSGANDVVQAGHNIVYGGTLNLLNISGAPLAAGNSFQIFNASSYSSSFTAINPTSPGPGLGWDTTHLNTGKINVVAAPTPVISSIAISGNNLILSGTNGPASGNYIVVTSTNIAMPTSNWTVLSTDSFDASGVFHTTNILNPAIPQLFYQLKTQ
jgi:hypothetical protein